ncbi:MAG TPA: bifunctional hydroxymethylpyrimidine kinase/phosphomethylpyrimidine kinase [Castellaniella sp.]|uniref:bifunctional hydroxymethylpyrimidine kinase/phosphomethylpyrimidine kinase n=1 Tax=Castellaniella sp. TaxID=1955812 RepID=UPI002EF102E2
MAVLDLPATPLPLIFGPLDPSGASNLPADAVICAQLGTHAASVVTAIHVQDTTGVESIQRLSPELVDDQARCLLEDMAIGALKIGPQYDPETISVLAQITADYSALPLVLQLSNPPPVPDVETLDAEETVSALVELLVPQALMAVVDAGLLELWAGQGLLSSSRASSPIEALHDFGVSHVLCSNAALSPELNGITLYSRGQPSRRWPWAAPSVRVSDAEGLLATILTCLLARGEDPQAAARQAVTASGAMLSRHFHPGMGQRILLHTTP